MNPNRSAVCRALATGLLAFLAAPPLSAQVISETFTSSAANFTVSGGTWAVSNGKYVLTNPVVGGTGLNSRSIHNTTVSGDWTLTVDAATTATSSVWNDFGIIFGYQNSTNYYYFSSNESNDAGTSGIMKVTAGTVTQLADITSPIVGGTTYAAKIEKTGTTYKVYRNNTLLATATDGTWTSGKVGLGTLSDGATFDNFVVNSASAPPGYYVDPATGSMSNPGTYAAPWSTLQAVFAAGKTFVSGDVIYLRSGNHGFPVITSDNTGNVTISKQSGHDPIVNRIDFNGATRWVVDGVKIFTSAAPPDPVPLVHPVYPVYNDSLVRITGGSSFITLKNCTVYSATSITGWTANDWNTKAWTGIYMNGASNNLTIDACTVRNVNFGIHMNGDCHHLTIKNSIVENYCGDGLRAGCNDLNIEYNIIRDAYATNGNHYDIIQGFASARVVIRGNQLYNTTSSRSLMTDAQAIGAFDGWFDNWTVENNIVANGHWHGITLLGARNCRVVNNTVVKNPFSTSSSTPWIQIGAHKDGTPSSGNYCRNNLTSDISTMSGTTTSNNIETTAYTSHFVNYAGLNFHLKSGSTAINAGTTSQAPTIDFEKQARSSPYDVGADEL